MLYDLDRFQVRWVTTIHLAFFFLVMIEFITETRLLDLKSDPVKSSNVTTIFI